MSRLVPGGRHRLGQPGLRHCRNIPEVQLRLADHVERTRHANPGGAWRVRPSYAVGAGVAAAVVSGWFTAGQALAQHIAGR